MGGRVPSGGTCSTYGTRVTSLSLLHAGSRDRVVGYGAWMFP